MQWKAEEAEHQDVVFFERQAGQKGLAALPEMLVQQQMQEQQSERRQEQVQMRMYELEQRQVQELVRGHGRIQY